MGLLKHCLKKKNVHTKRRLMFAFGKFELLESIVSVFLIDIPLIHIKMRGKANDNVDI